MDGVLVYIFHGKPMTAREVYAAFDVALLYMRAGYSGEYEFVHRDARGTIEFRSADSLGVTNGSRMRIKFGNGREVTYLVPYRSEDLPVGDPNVTFKKPKRASKAKPQRIPPAARLPSQNAPTSRRLQ